MVAALGAAAGRVAAPPELGSHWAALDREATQLLCSRDIAICTLASALQVTLGRYPLPIGRRGLLKCFSLQEYSAACIWLLPESYGDTSMHGAWAAAILEALAGAGELPATCGAGGICPSA